MTTRIHYEHVVRDGLVLLTLEGSRALLRDALLCEGAMRAWHALADAKRDAVLAVVDGDAVARNERAQTLALRDAVALFVSEALASHRRPGLGCNVRGWTDAARKVIGSARSIAFALGEVEEAAEIARDEQGDERGATGCEPWLSGFEARVRGRERLFGPGPRDGWREADRLLAEGVSRAELLADPSRFWAAAGWVAARGRS